MSSGSAADILELAAQPPLCAAEGAVKATANWRSRLRTLVAAPQSRTGGKGHRGIDVADEVRRFGPRGITHDRPARRYRFVTVGMVRVRSHTWWTRALSGV